MKKERKIVLAKKHGYAWLWLILSAILTVLAIADTARTDIIPTGKYELPFRALANI